MSSAIMSAGIAVFAIILVIIVVGMILVLATGLALYELIVSRRTKKNDKRRIRKTEYIGIDEAGYGGIKKDR